MIEQDPKFEVSIIMPCLNEAETLEACIEKARQSIKKYNLNAEILISDNGSQDGSQEIAQNNGVRIVYARRKGYGSALLEGIAAAKGKYIIMGDADDSYDFSGIYPFVVKLREGFDLVMGCRLPRGGGKIMPGAMPLKHRYFGNPALSFIGRLFFKSGITDFHCGLRGFRKDAFIQMDLHTTGMEFASEMVIKATLLKMRVAEVPITLYKDGRSRPPHLRSWRDGWRHLRFMLMYSPKWLFLTPGILFLSVGTILFLILMNGTVTIGRVGFESNSLLVAGMSILVGFQLASFYLFTKVFAVTEGFLPKDEKIERFTSIFSLELGVIAGVIFFILGAFLFGSALMIWQQSGFGELSHTLKIKKVIPSITFILLGLQIVLSSFFLSILNLRRK